MEKGREIRIRLGEGGIKSVSKCKKNFYNSIDISSAAKYNDNIRGGIYVDERGRTVMRFDDMFENRDIVAFKLKNILRDFGYTKVSFSEMTGISRPTLDKLLNAAVDSKSTFDKHLRKILDVLNISAEALLFYSPAPKAAEAVYSNNAPADHRMNEKAQKQYHLLEDVLELCTIYY